ncbi:MAG: hypothetical protein ACT4O9_13700 [Blastocatellia bacterium]
MDFLRSEEEQINPAIILAERLMRRGVEELLTIDEVNEAETILNLGTQEIEDIDAHRKAFLKTSASAVKYIPIGF